MKFDTFLGKVNDWGQFQKQKYTLICLTYMLPSMMVYTYTFTAAKPDFFCSHEVEKNGVKLNSTFIPFESQCKAEKSLISLKECQRCYKRSNDSSDRLMKCENFVFDKTDFESTLVEEWSMVCDRLTFRSTVQIIFFIGYMIGSIFFGMLADIYGRRPIMSVSFILMTISGFLCAFGPQKAFGFWPSYLIYMFGRFLMACSTRGISVSGFVLGSEIVGPSKRLLTGIVIEYFFAFGQLFLVLFAYFIRTWETLSWAISVFTIPFIFFYFVLPESPRWLVSRGRFDDAEKILRDIAKINKRDFDSESYAQVKAEQEKNMHRTGNQEGVMSLFRTRFMLLISLNLFFQWLVQNLVFYGVSQSTDTWKLRPHASFAVSAVVELIAYIFVHMILDRVGRKIPYCTFAILFGITAIMILPVQTFFEKDSSIQKWLMNTINGLLKFFASGSYATIYIFANELFPTNVRNSGMGLCSMVARIGAIIGTYCNDSLTRLHIYLPALFYGSVSLLAAFLAIMLPETLNKTLPETVEDVEKMAMTNVRIDASRMIRLDNTEHKDNLLATHIEDSAIKGEIQNSDLPDKDI